MTPLIFASAMALFRATLSSPDPLFPTDGSGGGPVPVNGVWAGLPADCAVPTSLDLGTWPKCATPVGFLDGEIAVLEKPAPGQSRPPEQYYSVARTKFWSIRPSPDAGAPAIVQVDIPILFASSTIYIAVTPDAVDGGRFSAATGWPIGCPPPVGSSRPQTGGRCTAASADGVRAAARVRPDPSKTYRLVRVNPEAAPAPVASPVSPPPPAPPSPLSTKDTPPGPSATPPATPPTAPPGTVTESPLLPPPGSNP